MKKYICMALMFGMLFVAGCEKRTNEEGAEKSQENSTENTSSSSSSESASNSDSEIQTQAVDIEDGRPHEEVSVYSFFAVYQKYFPGKTENTLDALNQSNTPSVMYKAQNDFLNLWEYWVEKKQSESDKDGIMKLSGKMYEEHENTIRDIIESSKEIKDQWDDVDTEVKKTCQAQKQEVKCD